MWPRRRNRAVSAAILLLFHAFAGGHAKRGHDGLALYAAAHADSGGPDGCATLGYWYGHKAIIGTIVGTGGPACTKDALWREALTT